MDVPGSRPLSRNGKKRGSPGGEGSGGRRLILDVVVSAKVSSLCLPHWASGLRLHDVALLPARRSDAGSATEMLLQSGMT